MNLETILWIYYGLSVVYCMWRIIKRYKHVSHDGVIGITPGLDLIMVFLMAPILAIADVVVTWIIMINTYYKKKKKKKNKIENEDRIL